MCGLRVAGALLAGLVLLALNLAMSGLAALAS